MKSSSRKNVTASTIPAFDRFMFSLLRMKPLPIHKKEGVQVSMMTVLKIYGQSNKKYPWTTFITLVAATLASLSSVVAPYIFKRFLDLLGQGVGVVQMDDLYRNIFLFFVVSTLTWAFWRLCYFANSYLAAHMLASLRQRAFAYLLGHSHQFFINTFAGSLVQKVNRFASSYDKLADRVLYDIIPIVVQVIFILSIMFIERPIIAVVVLIWATIFIAWNYTFAKWKLKYDTSRAVQDSLSSGTLADFYRQSSDH